MLFAGVFLLVSVALAQAQGGPPSTLPSENQGSQGDGDEAETANSPSGESNAGGVNNPAGMGNEAAGNANQQNTELENQGEGQNNRTRVQELAPESVPPAGVGNQEEDNPGQNRGASSQAIQKAQQKMQEGLSKAQGNQAQLHQQISTEVSQKLQQVAQGEEPQVQNRIHQVAQEQAQLGQEVSQSVEKVEKRGGVAKFFIGSDYKNLGQLRSSLAKNENQIRQLTQTLDEIESEEDKQVVKEQIALLMEDRAQLKSFVRENEEGFSVLGWAFRMMNGYDKDSIDEQEEQELENEVEEALEEDELEEETL